MPVGRRATTMILQMLRDLLVELGNRDFQRDGGDEVVGAFEGLPDLSLSHPLTNPYHCFPGIVNVASNLDMRATCVLGVQENLRLGDVDAEMVVTHCCGDVERRLVGVSEEKGRGRECGELLYRHFGHSPAFTRR